MPRINKEYQWRICLVVNTMDYLYKCVKIVNMILCINVYFAIVPINLVLVHL